MTVSKAEIKELDRQLEAIGITDTDFPTLEDRKNFIASQIEQTQGAIYRTIVDAEVAHKFIAMKGDAYQEKGKERLTESLFTLRAYKPTLDVFVEIAKKLEA